MDDPEENFFSPETERRKGEENVEMLHGKSRVWN